MFDDDEKQRGVKIYDSPTKKIFFDISRSLITTEEKYITQSGNPGSSTSFFSVAYIEFREREDMLFEILYLPSVEIVNYLFTSWGIQDYEITERLEKYRDGSDRHAKCIEFTSDTDYACFKLRFHEQITDARLKRDAR